MILLYLYGELNAVRHVQIKCPLQGVVAESLRRVRLTSLSDVTASDASVCSKVVRHK
jgi:hypothetical protein